MEAQAQAHAFQDDDVFKFACKSKRDLERALALDKAALSRVRGQLVQLGLNETAVNHTKLHIQRLEGIEELARARRLAAASRVQAWYRRQRQRQMMRGRLRMKICRGYLRYRYVKRAHDVFPGQFFYFYDRKVIDSHACLEFVGDFSRGVYSQPFPVHFSPHPVHHLGACATCIQRWYRGIKAKWRRVLEAIQRMVLDKARAVALQRNAAATKLQGLFRSRQAKRRLQLLVSSTFKECVDPATNMTFYYNAKTQVSQWTRPKLWKPAAAANTTKPRRPKLNLNDMDTPRRVQLCAVKIQGLFRTNLATKKLKLLVAQTYQKVLDPDTNQWYYYNAKTNASQWAKPALLGTGDMIHHASSSTLKEPRRLATKTSPYDGLLPTARRKDVAAVKIQGLFRTRNARRHLRHLIAQTYRKVFDADANMCYYYNAKTGESHWTKPTLLGAADVPEPIASVSNVTTALPSTALNTLPTPRRIEVAATKIQGLFRTRNARRRLRHLIAQTYQKVLDVDSQQFYYFNTKTGESQWGKPILLGTGDMEELVPPPQNTPRPRVSQQRSPKLTTLSTPRRVEVAATKIQGLYRTRNARCRLRHLIAQTYQRVLDTDSQQFYYYNTKTGESQWVKPVLLGTSDLVDETQVRYPTNPRKRGGDPRAFLVGLNPVQQRQAAATKLQGLFRARLARRRLVGLIASTYHKFVDEESQASYYYNVKTGESSWVKPALLRSDTLPRQ
ncbi:hypothetical protein B5M09_002959 [Aphanomyces astaci]|uniref:WW domain-containing protein n=1 Tax=Aphanomyces astaci TaxID=112090 RepID=A0A3R7X2Z4_APHAT|nr:hypothetical protein B5M09_002959 [Aphanomyces astaci]